MDEWRCEGDRLTPPTGLLCTHRGKKAAEASQRWKKQKLPRQQLWGGGAEEEEGEEDGQKIAGGGGASV